MGLLDRFRRPQAPHPSTEGLHAPAQDGGHRAGPTAPGSELAEGVAVRQALERGDVDQGVAAGARFRASRAAAQGRAVDPAFDTLPRESVAFAFELGCYDELGLSPAATGEARLALGMANAAWTDAASGLVAVYLALPADAPLRWDRFAAERARFRDGEAPYMWQKNRAVLAGDPVPLADTLADLSRDARDVLAHPKLVRRRQIVDRQHLQQRTYLPGDRLEQALAELRAAGFAGVPGWGDRLGELTVHQLKAVHGRLGLPGTGTKPRLVQALVENVSADQLHDILAAASPALLDADLVVGLGLGKQADWLLHFCELAGHWLQFQHYRGRDRRQLLEEGTVLRGYRVDRHDDCPVCAAGPGEIGRDMVEALPPFHIGCRCTPIPKV